MYIRSRKHPAALFFDQGQIAAIDPAGDADPDHIGNIDVGLVQKSGGHWSRGCGCPMRPTGQRNPDDRRSGYTRNTRPARVLPALGNTPDRPESCYNDRRPVPGELRLQQSILRSLQRWPVSLHQRRVLKFLHHRNQPTNSLRARCADSCQDQRWPPAGCMDCRRVVALRNASGPNLAPRRLECVQSLGMPTTPICCALTSVTSHLGPSNKPKSRLR